MASDYSVLPITVRCRLEVLLIPAVHLMSALLRGAPILNFTDT